MAEILSQQQIDELLGSLQSGNVDFKDVETQSSGPKVKEYDFMSPKKFSREQLKLLDNIFDNFARMLSLQLASMLRISCQMEVLQVEEEDYKEFNNALNDSVLVAMIGMHNADHRIDGKQILLEMARPISFSVIDRMLGGSGTGYNIERDYTDIELALVEYLFKQMLSLLKNSWSNYIEIEHTLDMIETNSRLIQSIQPDESVAIVVIEMTLDDNLKGNMNICLPAASLEEIFKVFNSKYVRIPRKDDPEVEQERKEIIMKGLKASPLYVSAVLGKTQITLKDFLGLQVGDVITLNTPLEENQITVCVEDLPWFTGVVGTKKKKYAVKIDQIL
ncbi:MAG: flagellar motor switch protein FliM [Clostridium sp.]|uniref:flagellar motor switch protein FliM n=1 Tax=Clostridium sp. TaxID=1506 RepID=UPI0029089732|nr:flagellar motor switch protein FliM [Clostridium sp.]MDU7336998.1 flagellar motor switch protein FliM [Clostridium sp.]